MRSIYCALVLGVVVSTTLALDQSMAGELPPPPSSDPANYENLTQAVLDCPNVQGAPLAGVVGCEDGGGKPGFKRRVLELVIARAKKTEELRYDGKEVLDWASAETKNAYVPVCNVTAGEIKTNRRGQSCGQPCHFDVSGWSPSVSVKYLKPYCERERAWYVGAEVQMRKFFTLQVLQEFKKSGRIKLSKLFDYENGSPTQPGHLACHPMAADVMGVQRTELNGLLDEIVKKYGRDHAAKLVCDRNESNVSMMAPCNLEMIQTRLASFWNRLISCEAFVRTHNERGRVMSTPEALQDRATSVLEPKCRGQYNADCSWCRNSTREKRLNRCYENELPGFMQNEYRLYDTRELERELGVHASNSSGFSGFAFALGALVRRRARKGPKAKGVDRSVLVLLLIVVTALGLLSGCGACDDEQLTLEQPPFQCGTERTTGEFGEVVCPGTPDDPEEPQADFAGGGGDLGGMQTDGGTVREEMGLDDIKAPAKPKSGHREESLAATAVDKPTNNKLTPFTPTGGKGGSGEGGGPNLALPQLGKSGPGKDAESGSNITGSAGVGLAATAESKEEKPAAGEAEPETTFADAGGAGKGAGGAGVGGFGGFGESGPTGGGADVAAYGTGDGDTLGGGGSMEDYLSKVGRTSLFEVVNRRTEKFNIQIDAHAATGEFRKMTR